MKKHKEPAFYRTAPLSDFTITDLTDALGVARSVEILNTSARSIYTVRHTDKVGLDRQLKLIRAVEQDEAACRERLVVLRTRQHATRAPK